MQIISFANHKGGVAKTTSVASIGVALSQIGRRVLLIDLDPQTNLTDLLSQSGTGRTLYDSLRDLKGLPVTHLREGLDLCPSSIDMVSIDIELADLPDRGYRLQKLLEGLDYDYILLDCPPNLGLLTQNALSASTKVIIPLTPEAFPAKGLGTLLNVIDLVKRSSNPSLELGGILITRYNRRKINRLVEETLRENFKDLVFKTKIRENVDLIESPLEGKDIFTYSPDSIGAKDYTEVAKEILENLK